MHPPEQICGCRDLFGTPGWPYSHCAAPDFGEANGMPWQRKQLCAEAAGNPGQAAAGAACGWILCMADSACLELQRGAPCKGAGAASSPSLHQYFGQNTLFSWTERSKGEVGEKHLPRNFSEQGCSNFSEQSALLLHFISPLPEAGKKKSQ